VLHLNSTDVSRKFATSIFRVEEYAKEETGITSQELELFVIIP
jgi:hypothetical protein